MEDQQLASIEYRRKLRTRKSLDNEQLGEERCSEPVRVGVTRAARKRSCVNSSYVVDDIVQDAAILKLSLEVLCKVLKYLPLKEILKLERVCRRLRDSVCLHLRVCQSINFIEGRYFGYMSDKMNDDSLAGLLSRCPDLQRVYGLFPRTLLKRRIRGQIGLSIPGIIASLNACKNLIGVELDNTFLLEAILRQMPRLVILNTFRNSGECFPPSLIKRMTIPNNPRITNLQLHGISLTDLPILDHVQELYLQFVRFTGFQPFRNFRAQNLKTFVMSNCAGPLHPLKYVPLAMSLGASRNLNRLELVRVPFFGNLFQHVVEDTWKLGGFRNLRKLLISACKNMTETDLGHLVLTAALRMKELLLQPSLSRDSFFFSLAMTEASFPSIEALELGYEHPFPQKGKYTNQQIVSFGLADVTEHPGLITDAGMKLVGQVFSLIKTLIINNCPHLHLHGGWQTPDGRNWRHLRHLELNRCHSISLESLCFTIHNLPHLEYLSLREMFKEPPKGCSRVGLSAGTGLGVASALMTNQDPGGAAAAAAAANAPVPVVMAVPAVNNNQPQNDDNNAAPVPQQNIPDVANNSVEEMDVDVETVSVQEEAKEPTTNEEPEKEIESSAPANAAAKCCRCCNKALDEEVKATSSGQKSLPERTTAQDTYNSDKDTTDDEPSNKKKKLNHNQPKKKVVYKGKGKRLMGKKRSIVKRSKQNSGEADGSGTSAADGSGTSAVDRSGNRASDGSGASTSSAASNHNNDIDSIEATRSKIPESSKTGQRQNPGQGRRFNDVDDFIQWEEFAVIPNDVSVSAEPREGAVNCESCGVSMIQQQQQTDDHAFAAEERVKCKDENISDELQQIKVEEVDEKVNDSDEDKQECTAAAAAAAAAADDDNDDEGQDEKDVMMCEQLKEEEEELAANNNERQQQHVEKVNGENAAGADDVQCVHLRFVTDYKKKDPKDDNNVRDGGPGVNRLRSVGGVSSESNTAAAAAAGAVAATGVCSSGSQADDNPRNPVDTEPKPGCSNQYRPASPDGSTRMTRSKKRSMEESKQKQKKEEASRRPMTRQRSRNIQQQKQQQQQQKQSNTNNNQSENQRKNKNQRNTSGSRPYSTPTERLTRRGAHPADPDDPRLEDDTVQVLTLESNTLDCIHCYKCGVTDIVIDCPKLTHLEATGCRSLKNVDLAVAPLLQTALFTQCRKLNHSNLIDEVIKLPAITSRKINIRPMKNYKREQIEEILFNKNHRYNVMLTHDHAPEPADNFYQKAWMRTAFDAMSDAHRWLYNELQKEEWQKRALIPRNRVKFPWGKDLMTFTGCGDAERKNVWDLVTDVPWFKGDPVLSDLWNTEKKKFILKWSAEDLKQSLDVLADYLTCHVTDVKHAMLSVVVTMCDHYPNSVKHDVYL